ncbi:MAG: S8 family serine peptidase [Mycobacterium sp.]
MASAPAPAMSFGFARPAAVSGLVSSITTALFGSNPQSPLGWAMLAGARGSIGGNRRGGALAAGSATAARAPAAGGPATPPPFASNEVLVGFKPGATSAGRAQAMANVNAKVIGRLGTKQMLKTDQGVVYRLSVPGGTAAAIQALSRNPAVAFVEPNYRLTSNAVASDNYYTSGALWGMQSDDTPIAYGPAGTTNQYGIGAEEAWGLGVTGSRNVVVGVIDEGIQITHPDLAANIWTNPGEVAGDGIDNDGNGYVDDVNGWDFYYDDNTVYDVGEDAHGTHVAGTIGAVGGNSTGVAGVNWTTTIIPAKFLGPQGGYISDAVDALNYLTDLKSSYNVNLVAVNNSWGGGGYSNAMQGAINRAAKADILFVAAAGNSTSNNDATASYPSNYSSLTATATESAASYDSVIAVASISSTGALSSFSSYGATTVDIAAPGSGIISTVPSNTYANYSGTSMATPHVTGALALYASRNPGISAAGLRSAILGNAKPTPSLAGKTVTGGRLSLEGLFADLPVVSISPVGVSVAEGNSGSSLAQFTVSLSSASASPVTVAYATAGGSATAGQDFTAVSGTVSFAAGQTSQLVGVSVLGDTAVEPNETFTVSLSAPSGAQLGAAVTGTVTIVNDDVPPPLPVVSISPVGVSVAEGDSGSSLAQFTVSLSS